MNVLKDFFEIFYPSLCVVCEQHLIQNENTVCTICRHDLPLTNFLDFKDNAVTKTFYGRVTVEKGYSLLFFRKKGATQKLIHDLKYKGNEDVGEFFGNWIGTLLKENCEFENVDYIIPVPLHPKKLRKRGYNQVAKFGKTLSNHLNIKFLENNLLRVSSSKTQTFKARFERFNNIDTKFYLKNPEKFNNKHVLIIDDVITTGATLEACINQFKNAKKTTISVLTMAYTD